jgi:hypothetical protein
MSRSLRAFLALAIAVGVLAFAGLASANGGNHTPPPAAQLPSTVTLSVAGANATASDVATGRVTVLSYVMARGLSHRVIHQSKYRWVGAGTNVPVYWNSGRSASGGLFWFRDTRRVKIYRVGHSWRKARCGNLIRFTQPKAHVVHGRVIVVRSFATATVKIRATATSNAVCSAGLSGASANATATAIAKVSLRSYLRSKGAASVKLYATVSAKASASASAQVSCVSGTVTTTVVVPPPPTPPPAPPVTPPMPPKPPKPPTPPTPPVNHKPSGKIFPPQHVYVNGQAKVCVDNVGDPDGDQISVAFSVTAGQMIGSVFTQPGGAMCQTYQGPSDPQQVTVTAVLTDGKGGSLTLSDNFPVIPDQF